MKSILNIGKTKDVLDALVVLHNDIRSKIFIIVLKAEEDKKDINIRGVHQELQKMKIKIAYKNCAAHLKEIEKVGLFKLDVIKYSRGQKTLVKPTQKAHKIKSLLFDIKDLFT